MRFGAVIPHFNDSRFLRDAILGYLEDPPAPDSLIVVDDGSSESEREKAAEIVRSLQAERGARLAFHATASNRGPIATQNTGLALVDCDFVQFRAADDQSAHGYMRHVRNLCRQHPNAGLAVGDIVYRAESRNGGVLESLGLGEEGYIGPDQLAGLLNGGRILHSATAWYHARHFRETGGFCAATDLYHDWWACHQLAFRHGVVYAPHPAAYFTLRSDSQSSTHFQDAARARRSVDAIHARLDAEDEPVRRRFLQSGVMDFFGSVDPRSRGPASASSPGGIPEVLRARLSSLHPKISGFPGEVWIYGTGNHSRYLVAAWSDLRLPEIRGFVQTAVSQTDDPVFLGKPVFALDGFHPQGAALVVLSSKSFEEAMARTCRTLVPAPRVLSFWNHELTTL